MQPTDRKYRRIQAIMGEIATTSIVYLRFPIVLYLPLRFDRTQPQTDQTNRYTAARHASVHTNAARLSFAFFSYYAKSLSPEV